MFQVTNEETLSMNPRRSLRHLIRQPSGTAGGARRERSAGAARARAARGILVPAFVLASLGTTAAASHGYGIGGPARPGAQQRAGRPALLASAESAGTCRIGKPAAVSKMPWMYIGPSKMPWMYAGTGTTPRMSAAIGRTPWMYAPVHAAPGHVGCLPDDSHAGPGRA